MNPDDVTKLIESADAQLMAIIDECLSLVAPINPDIELTTSSEGTIYAYTSQDSE